MLDQTLVFKLQTLVRIQEQGLYSRLCRPLGNVEVRAAVQGDHPNRFRGVRGRRILRQPSPRLPSSATDPALDQPVNFENPIPLNGKTPLCLKAPSSNETYARVSGDYNPIHVSRIFSKYANLPGTITHGMYSSAAVRSLVETWAAENNVGRVRSFHASLVGMVLPDDTIEVNTAARWHDCWSQDHQG